jgi:hypothetical protein
MTRIFPPDDNTEYIIQPVLLRFRSNHQYLTSVAQAIGRWNKVQVVPCKANDPRRTGWGLFHLNDGKLGEYICVSDDLRVIQATLDSYQS